MRIFPPFSDVPQWITPLQSQGSASSSVPGSIVHRRYLQFSDAPVFIEDLPFGSAAVVAFNPAWAAKANRLISGGFSS